MTTPLPSSAEPALDPPGGGFRAGRATRFLFVLGLAFYVGVVWYVGWRDVRDELVSARKLLILASLALIVAAAWIRSLKWRIALGPGQNAFSLFFLSKVTANWSPGRLGEFSPMILKRHRTPKVGAWIMFDRILEIVTTLALGFLGLAFIDLLPPGVFTAALAVAVAATLAGLYALTRRSWFLWVAGRSRENSLVHRFTMLLSAISHELFTFGRTLPVTGLITVVTKCMDLYAIQVLFIAFGVNPGFWVVSTAKCALAIVSFIPLTPIATGIPHFTQARIMIDAAGIPGHTLAAAIGVEVVIVNVALLSSFGLVASALRSELRRDSA